MMKKHVLVTSFLACCVLAILSCRKAENPVIANNVNNERAKQNNAFITGAVPTGTYKIVTAMTVNVTNKVLGIHNNSYQVAEVIKQLNYASATGRDWRFLDLGNGYHAIVNAFTNQALSYAGTTEHTSVIQFPYGATFTDSQQWKVEYQGAYGLYRIKTKQALTKGIHVDPSSIAHGATIKIQTYDASRDMEGYFLMEPVTAVYADPVSTNFFKRSSGITATDGALSFPLTDGRVFWSSGDSHYNDYSAGAVNCLFNRRSVSWIQPSKTNWNGASVTTLPGSTGAGFYSAPGATYSWPAAGFAVGSTAYVYLLPDGGTSSGYLARVNTTTNTISGYTKITNVGAGIMFGSGFVKETDGYIYAFGNKLNYISGDVYVARFPQSNPTSSTWTFWNGSSWVSSVASAVPIANVASTSLGVCKVNNKYIIIASEFNLGCDGGTEIYTYTSVGSTPTGGFKAPKTVFTIPDRLADASGTLHSPFFYGPIPHTEFNSNNELLIIYSINAYGNFGGGTPCVETCSGGKMNPDITYRPRGVRVPFSIIDPTL